MAVQHGGEIQICHIPCTAQNQVFFLQLLQIEGVVAQCLNSGAFRQHASGRGERRQVSETAVLTVQIPFSAGLDMMHEAVVLLAHDETDAAETSIGHVAQAEVDQPVFRAERNGRQGAAFRQFLRQQSGVVRQNNSCSIHTICLLSAYSRHLSGRQPRR